MMNNNNVSRKRVLCWLNNFKTKYIGVVITDNNNKNNFPDVNRSMRMQQSATYFGLMCITNSKLYVFTVKNSNAHDMLSVCSCAVTVRPVCVTKHVSRADFWTECREAWRGMNDGFELESEAGEQLHEQWVEILDQSRLLELKTDPCWSPPDLLVHQ